VKKYFISKTISYCYPYDYSRATKDYGILEQYVGIRYSREEMDKIICELITKHPYIENSMNLEINVMWETENAIGYYHMLSFENDNYEKQIKTDLTIKYEK
jgi:hypothetical protein